MIKKKLPNGVGQVVVNNDILDALKKGLGQKLRTQIGILGQKTERLQKLPDETHQQYKRRVKAWLKKRDGGSKGELTNAEIGAIHEFGIYSGRHRMPRRSFLKMPLMRSAKELFERKQTLQKYMREAIESGSSFEAAMYKAHQDLGIIGEQIVQRAFEQSGPGWPAKKRSTSKTSSREYRKMSRQEKIEDSRPLIDTGQLRRSISSRVVKA